VSALYPFSAVVGLDDLRLALVVNAVSPAVGGVLVRGEKGTKSTVVRALAALLPPVPVAEGCRFSCDPAAPDPACPDATRTTVRPRALPGLSSCRSAPPRTAWSARWTWGLSSSRAGSSSNPPGERAPAPKPVRRFQTRRSRNSLYKASSRRWPLVGDTVSSALRSSPIAS